tara:strand:- start:129 stop:533 length:405 start_codon:yes stop_codon:yes gene_type:complete
MIPIPAFLDRRNPECKLYIGNQKSIRVQEVPVVVPTNQNTQRALTNTFKSKMAYEIIQYVRRGFDTFGKLRKAISAVPHLGAVTDRELKAGVRYALVNRIPVPKVVGRGKSRQTTVRYFTLAKKSSKIYEAVEV